MWLQECKNFNKHKNRLFTLRGGAFTDRVTQILEMEKAEKVKKDLENKNKTFKHWFRKARIYFKNPLRACWYEIISGFKKDKVLHYWKNYYIKNIMK